MIRSFTRRDAMLATGATVALAATAGPAWATPVLDDVILGSEDAPVTVIEYASLTCPHCAAFHRDTYPRIKEEYIDTGKAKFIMREVYFDRFGFWASIVARCGGESAFYPMTDQFLLRQGAWTRGTEQEVAAEIAKIGQLNGLSAGAIEACLSDQDLGRALFDKYRREAAEDEVNSTPTFIINGDKHAGNMPFEDFAALIEAHL